MSRLTLFAHALLLTLLALPLSAQDAGAKRAGVDRALAQDRFVAGGQISTTAPVAGDLIAAGGELDVAADIGGDAAVAGGSLRLDGTVGQDLYAAGGRLSAHGAVQRNARIAGGQVEIGPRAKIAGNVSAAGGEVRVRGAIGGYLQVAGGNILLDGPVGGNVEIAGGALELGPNARIEGRLRYASRDELRRDPAAQVRGGVERFDLPATGMPEGSARILGWLWSIGLLVIAAVLAAAAQGLYSGVAATARTRWARALLVGFIALVCIPAAALIAALTVIGLPLALVCVALFLALLPIGYVSTGISAGALALQRLQPARASQTAWRVAAAVLGMFVLSLLARLPWVGGVVVIVATLLGVGALLTQLARAVRET
jgi:cytoskeletal protein CcmA (bactofilin family)